MRKNRIGGFLIVLGLLLAVSAFGLTGYNLWDDARAANAAKAVLDDISTEIPDKSQKPDYIPDYILNPNMDMPTVESGGYNYIGKLTISVLDIELPVMDSWSYPRLKIAPCRYSGSAYLNDLVIAAHNYSFHFGRLKNLREGDDITFTDADGNVFEYEVDLIETLRPTDVEKMTSGDWDLTLFTCTVGGRTRVTVRCVLKEN